MLADTLAAVAMLEDQLKVLRADKAPDVVRLILVRAQSKLEREAQRYLTGGGDE